MFYFLSPGTFSYRLPAAPRLCVCRSLVGMSPAARGRPRVPLAPAEVGALSEPRLPPVPVSLELSGPLLSALPFPSHGGRRGVGGLF